MLIEIPIYQPHLTSKIQLIETKGVILDPQL